MKTLRTKCWDMAVACMAVALLLVPMTVSAATDQKETMPITQVAAAPLPNRQCDPPGPPRVSPACPGGTAQAIGTTNYDAARTDTGNAATAIDAWGYCRYV